MRITYEVVAKSKRSSRAIRVKFMYILLMAND